ncbi:MAG: hypothetical protein QT03_C0001G0743 [archaeon GW2011_AR10]|uniref:Uncharacterized protein n=3 Tax=Candidatus Iainarchaeum sp. TaxID=3101447 RepID=A0A7J4IYR8_9ARCH|nr:MAG: hypothetical protein QT03_C0001G0743 [archaeon GW2011_AR10]HIH08927.1 hypothetical protein [Candidatus Diapherotrites archaeon]
MTGIKGFTLFTALVAFILIVLSVLLVQTMIRTERNTTDIISDIQEEQEMQAIADLARAEALQTFNYGIRFSIEDWLTKDGDGDGIPDNAYLLTPSELAGTDAESWENTKKKFAESNFGVGGEGTQFANRAANHLSTLLASTPDVRGFQVNLDNNSQAVIVSVLEPLFEDSSARQDFFEVIRCDGTWDGCPIGTFYVNLDIARLTDEQYEKLPQIVVKKITTKGEVERTLREPILPRGNLQIYVPIRIFKAIAGARDVARTGSGFYSGAIDATLLEVKLGVCGENTCVPEYHSASGPDIEGFACVGDTYADHPKISSIPVLIDGTSFNYDPNNEEEMRSRLINEVGRPRLLNFFANELTQNLPNDLSVPAVDFRLVTIPAGSGYDTIQRTSVIVVTPKTRQVDFIGAPSGEAVCARIDRVGGFLVFEDTKPDYMVSELPKYGSLIPTNRYAVRLSTDSFSGEVPAVKTCETIATPTGIDLADFTYRCEFRG